MAIDSFARTLGLSAVGVGEGLSAEINNLKNIGRFLALWDCATGLPLTDPTTMPYTYRTGDYYRVSNVATGSNTNYKPNGSTYNHVASTTVETESVAVGWIYYYDGTTWIGQSDSGSAVHYTPDSNKTSLEKAQARTNINAQEVLPDAVAGKYLHANTSTGALEWAEVEVSGGNLYRHDIEMSKTTSNWEISMYLSLYTTSATPFNISTLTTYLKNCGITKDNYTKIGCPGVYAAIDASTQRTYYPVISITTLGNDLIYYIEGGYSSSYAYYIGSAYDKVTQIM